MKRADFSQNVAQKELFLSPNEDAGDGKTVFDLLESKHPDQREADPEIFQEVLELPMLINVDITSSHVEKAARTLRGSAGPNGVDGNLLQSIILHYGKPSEDL